MSDHPFDEYPYRDLERRECEHGFRAWNCPTRDCRVRAEVWDEYNVRAKAAEQERVQEIPASGPYRTSSVDMDEYARWTEYELDQIAAVGQRQLLDAVADGRVQTVEVTAVQRRLRTSPVMPADESPPPPPRPTIFQRVRRLFYQSE